MKKLCMRVVSIASLLFLAGTGQAGESFSEAVYPVRNRTSKPFVILSGDRISNGVYKVWDFENVETGNLSVGWEYGATEPKGEPLRWGIIKNGQNKALGIINNGGIEKNRVSFSQFNICWLKGVQFGGEIEIRMKAVSGKVDQGGGPIWRVFDSDNYYVARANPLEGNFRVYYVRNGKRVQIASADVDTEGDKWYTIKIVHRGDNIEGFLNGRKYIEVKSDMLPDEGGIGVWTKADALSYFDDIKVTIK